MFISTLSSALGEKMALGGKIALMGVLVVFALLVILVIVLQCFDIVYKARQKNPEKFEKIDTFFKKLKPKHKKKGNNGNVDVSTVPENAENTAEIVVSDDGELVAAITGALSVILQEENNFDNSDPDKIFVVRKIKKLNFRR